MAVVMAPGMSGTETVASTLEAEPAVLARVRLVMMAVVTDTVAAVALATAAWSLQTNQV
jgi:hypothetical protein